MELLKQRKNGPSSDQVNYARRRKEKGPSKRDDHRSISEGSRDEISVGEKPFQRSKHTTPRNLSQPPKLTASPVLRAYIAGKSGSGPVAPAIRIDKITEPASSSAQGDKESPDRGLAKRRRRVFSTASYKPEETQPRKLIKGGVADGAVAPRTRQMHPPGFNLPGNVSRFSETTSSGVTAPGSVHSEDSGDLGGKFSLRKRTHKKISPEEVRYLSHLNAEQGAQSLNDAEALWQMSISPVYGDPKCLEGEFIELPIRFAKRGLRWN